MTRDRSDGPRRTPLRRAADWLFVNRSTGRITVGQFPNWSLALFLVASVLAWALGASASGDSASSAATASSLTAAARVAGLVATGAIGWWALDELFCGVNPMRRLLGAIVLAVVVGGAVGAILA